jgi:Phage protein
MILGNDLGCFDPAWRGWILRGGQLISPEGWEARPGDVLTLPLLRAQIATYQAKERAALAMDAQPEPGELPAIRA